MLLELEDLRVKYGEGSKALMAVDGVSLGVPKGGTLGLVGESGCGKSSLARAVAGLTPVDSGRIRLDGRDVTSTKARNEPSYRGRVQMIFQDPSSSLNPRMTVGDMLGEAVGIAQRTRRSARLARSRELLEMVGLPNSALFRYTHEFSGGQRQRIAVARALAVEPELIVTDEVTSALDVSVQATMLNLLRDLQRELNLSYLFISHDLSTVRFMSNKVAVMYLGRIVESADADELFAAPRHPYTRVLMDSIPQIALRERPRPLAGEIPDPRNPPRGCRFHTRCPVGPRFAADRTICMEQDPTADAGSRPHEAACHFPVKQEREDERTTHGDVTAGA